MKRNLIKEIYKLRNSIAFLMEHEKWCGSLFYEENSKDFLKYIFPKSYQSTSKFSLDTIRNLLDKEIGANYYHLFRLPMAIEEQLQLILLEESINIVLDKEGALKYLVELSENLKVENAPGPKRIGLSEKLNEDVVQVFAAEYLSAFKNDYQVHPYLN